MPTTPRPDTRERILDAALRTLLRLGIAKTTMKDVSRAAGVSRASLYRYFADRETLVEATVRHHVLKVVAEEEPPPHLRPEASRRPFADRLVEGIVHDVSRGSADPLMLLLSTDPRGASTSIGRPRLYAELNQQVWEPLLREAQETGQLREDLAIEDVADWIVRLEIMFMSQSDGRPETADEVRRYLRLFVVPSLVPAGD